MQAKGRRLGAGRGARDAVPRRARLYEWRNPETGRRRGATSCRDLGPTALGQREAASTQKERGGDGGQRWDEKSKTRVGLGWEGRKLLNTRASGSAPAGPGADQKSSEATVPAVRTPSPTSSAKSCAIDNRRPSGVLSAFPRPLQVSDSAAMPAKPHRAGWRGGCGEIARAVPCFRFRPARNGTSQHARPSTITTTQWEISHSFNLNHVDVQPWHNLARLATTQTSTNTRHTLRHNKHRLRLDQAINQGL